MEQMKKNFLNKIVQIYPRDSHYKYGKVIDINIAGVTFEITDCSLHAGYEVGQIVFISFSAKLTFSSTTKNKA